MPSFPFMLSAVKPALPLELSSGSLATRRRLAPSWPCRVLLLAVAVLRTVCHVLRIGQDVRSTLRRLQHRRRRSSTHSAQRHAGVTTWSASRSASRSAGRRTFRGRSPTRGRGQGRAWRCRRWRLPKRRSPRRIRKSSGRRGGRAGAEAEEGDKPGCEGVEALGVRWPRANPRVGCAFASLLAVCACAREAVIRSVRFSLFSVSMLLSSYES